MAVMGLLFPAVLHYTHTKFHSGELELALLRFYSCIMIVTYAAFLFFQLKSHNNPYDPLNEEWSQTEESSDDNKGPEILKWKSIIWLLIMTAWISILSEYLVHAISVVLLPILGNATKHASVIMFAVKDKLLPISVLVGWILGQPMDLNSQLFETAMLFMTVLVVAFMLQ
ncbi:vacuolar cation/proton exchanger 2, partial [Quercus suber]